MYFPPPSVPVTGKFNVFFEFKRKNLYRRTKKKKGALMRVPIEEDSKFSTLAAFFFFLVLQLKSQSYRWWRYGKTTATQRFLKATKSEATKFHRSLQFNQFRMKQTEPMSDKKNQWLIHRSLQFNQFRKFGGIRQNPCREK